MRISKELKRIIKGNKTFILEEVKEGKLPTEYWATTSTKKGNKTINRVKNLRAGKYEDAFNALVKGNK